LIKSEESILSDDGKVMVTLVDEELVLPALTIPRKIMKGTQVIEDIDGELRHPGSDLGHAARLRPITCNRLGYRSFF
jgi:hypothetical protein